MQVAIRGSTWLLLASTAVHSLWQPSHYSINAIAEQTLQSPFLLQEQPTTSLARPPVGVQSTLPQYSHATAVWE